VTNLKVPGLQMKHFKMIVKPENPFPSAFSIRFKFGCVNDLTPRTRFGIFQT
jgi:hypothetical protein